MFSVLPFLSFIATLYCSAPMFLRQFVIGALQMLYNDDDDDDDDDDDEKSNKVTGQWEQVMWILHDYHYIGHWLWSVLVTIVRYTGVFFDASNKHARKQIKTFIHNA